MVTLTALCYTGVKREVFYSIESNIQIKSINLNFKMLIKDNCGN